jgi:hypothetical protein
MCQCMFCGHNMRYSRAVNYAGRLFICCEWCETLLLYYGLCAALAQCMDCGVILSQSPFKGRVFLDREGKPNLSVGHSHGICEPCAKAKYDRWIEQKALRKAEQEALAASILQAV